MPGKLTPYFFSLLALLFIIGTDARALGLSAHSAVLYEPDTGRMLYEQGGGQKRAIASTTKIMTALVAFEHSQFSDTVRIIKEDTQTEGSSMYLKVGETVTVEDLLYGLLLMSGNDAALALARHCAGSVDAFVELMNEKAYSLGLENTCFENPNGLDGENHYSTAQDMAKLTACFLEIEPLLEICSTQKIMKAGRMMINHNRLLRTLEGADGVKTGYTSSAGRCLVSSVTREGKRLIAVTLDASDDWNDHKKLYEYGFSLYPPRVLTQAGYRLYDIPVISGDIAFVQVYAEDALCLCLSDEEFARLECTVELPRFVYAPVDRDTAAGSIKYTLDGKIVAKTMLLYAGGAEEIEPENPGFFESLWLWLSGLFT